MLNKDSIVLFPCVFSNQYNGKVNVIHSFRNDCEEKRKKKKKEKITSSSMTYPSLILYIHCSRIQCFLQGALFPLVENGI